MFKIIAKTVGLRVSPEEELEGLDFSEHAGNAYPDFEVSAYGGMVSGGLPGSARSEDETLGVSPLVRSPNRIEVS
jgi:Amt family ammonium transporter